MQASYYYFTFASMQSLAFRLVSQEEVWRRNLQIHHKVKEVEQLYQLLVEMRKMMNMQVDCANSNSILKYYVSCLPSEQIPGAFKMASLQSWNWKEIILALGYLYTKHDYAPWNISGLQSLTIILYNVLVLMQYLSTVSTSKKGERKERKYLHWVFLPKHL